MKKLTLLLLLLAGHVRADTLDRHAVVLDAQGKLLSWSSYADVATRSANFIKQAMTGPFDGGLPVIYTHSEYHPATFAGSGWPNNCAGKNAMLTDSPPPSLPPESLKAARRFCLRLSGASASLLQYLSALFESVR